MQLNNEETRSAETAEPPTTPSGSRGKALLVWFTVFLALVLLITFNMQ